MGKCSRGYKMQVHAVEVNKVEADTGHELSDTFYRVCSFCEKLIRITPSNFNSCLRLGNGKFYCPFCLRNNFHHRSSRNVLVFSFRGIIGYYYYRFYDVTPMKMWVSQIERYVEKHSSTGLQNPTLSYDPSTFLWFADFNRIGTDHFKAPFDELLSTVEVMFETFELKKFYPPHTTQEMWGRFSKAITLYYEQRKRPKGRRMLIPTFSKLLIQEKESFWDTTRDFVRNHLVLK